MKISYNWLQKYFIEKLPTPEDLSGGIIFHAFEIEEMDKVGDDTIFEIKILPDRAHDCLSHWGIAKEVSVIFNKTIAIPKIRETVFPEAGIRQDIRGNLEIVVNDNNCRRYMGRIIKGVKVGPSPLWLSKALISIGQKSINNIVDATNYVMFDIGNPIHAFDLDKLASPKIIVERAVDGEKLTLLDGKEVTLNSSIMTIRDNKDVLVVAGVKGGKKAEIDNNTVNIMIEVANFDPASVRRAAKSLSIFTDSTKRFENEISPELAPLAMDHVTDLILQIAGGEAYQIIDVYNNKEENKIVSLRQEYLNRMLGIKISKDDIDNILERFGYVFLEDGGEYQITIPPFRLDINEPHDMVEEIGRIYGYDKVTPALPVISFETKENKTWENINRARNYFTNTGYREVMTYTFTSHGDVEVMASASDKNFLRQNLSDGIKKSYELNKLNVALIGNSEIKIFEIGTVFPNGKEIINVCFANKKEIKETSLDEFVLRDEFKDFLTQSSEPVSFDKERESNTLGDLVFKTWSLYPYIIRDIAVWIGSESEVSKQENKEQLIKIYKELGGELLNAEPILFDEFSKEGRTSLAYRLVFQSYDRTLIDEEVSAVMVKINEKVITLGFQVR